KELDVDKSKAGVSADGAALSPAARLAWSDNDADAVVNATKDRAARQKKLAGLDKRIDDEKELDALYDKWIDLVATEQKSVLNRSLRGIAIILLILLLGLFFDQWIASLLGRTRRDRRSRGAGNVSHGAARDGELDRLGASDRTPRDVHEQLRDRRTLLQFLD